MKQIQINTCPSCKSNQFSEYMETKDYFFTQEKFSLSKCSQCNLVFTNPIPEDIEKYYETEDYLSHNTSSNNLISKIYSSVRSINLMNKYKTVSKFKKQGSILDIGCGTGELLSHFKKKNWEVFGIEPNKSAAQFAALNYNINVNNEEHINNIAENSFDVVSMWHVLEHVANLNERIQQVKKITKDDGIMVFAIPMLDSPDSKKYGKYWSALDVPRHLYHFTKESFSKLISQHDLKIIDSRPMRFDAYYISLLSEKYLNSRAQILKAIFNGLLSNFKANKTSNYSSMIFVVTKQY